MCVNVCMSSINIEQKIQQKNYNITLYNLIILKYKYECIVIIL